MSLRALALLVLLALAGCAAQVRTPQTAVRPDPAALDHWRATGRLALSAGREGGSGAFVWEQRERTTRLDLRGPLGVGALRVVASPGELSLTDGDGRRLDTEAARAELQARLGADLPWTSLGYWMLGIPAPTDPASVTDADQAPWRVIEQSGWQVGYEHYTTAAGFALPRKFTATRGGVRVRVVVDEWMLSPGGSGP